MGIELKVGMNILHFRPGPGGMIHEEAQVICVREYSIRVKFLGSNRSRGWGKEKGDESNLFNTSGKVFIINKDVELEKLAFQKTIDALLTENEILRREVDKIHIAQIY